MKVTIGPYKDDGSKRKEEVVIHNYDTWNMDHTLALIVLPMLKQLKETKHGIPSIDDPLDVPKELRYIPRQFDQRGTTDLFHNYDELGNLEFDVHLKQWEWIIDEMIWAFEEIVSYEENEPDFLVDNDEYFAYHDRMHNALKLFGKYYRSLWD